MSKNKLFIFLFFFLSLFFVTPVFASSITDSFDTYNLGDLDGQGSWATTVNSAQVVNTVYHNGTKSVALSGGNYYVGINNFSSSVSTTQSVWVYPTTGVDTNLTMVYLNAGGTYVAGVAVDYSTGEVYVRYGAISSSTGQYIKGLDQWSNIRWEYDGANNRQRISVDFAPWSDWYTVNNTGSVYRLTITSLYSNEPWYVDEFTSNSSAVNPDAELTIDDPTFDAFIPVGNYEFSGKCKNVGSNRLVLSPYFLSEIDNNQFTITCSDDYTWSATADILTGNRQMWIYDLDYNSTTTGNANFVDYTGYDVSSTDWSLGIVYPPDNGSHSFSLQYSDNYKFKFDYIIPDWNLVTTTAFVLTSFGNDNTFTTSTSELANAFLDFLDSDGYGSFIIDGILSTTTPQYYQADMYSNDVLVYRLRFLVVGSSDTTLPAPVDPDIKDCGYICNALRWAFVPRRYVVQDVFDDFSPLLETKFPFGYFTQMKNAFEDISVSSSSLSVDLSVPVDGQATMTMPFIDTSISPLQQFADGVRPYIRYLFYLLFMIWVIERVIDFTKTL